jgi:hypothetical protein
MPRKCIVIEYPNSGTLANILDRIGKRVEFNPSER